MSHAIHRKIPLYHAQAITKCVSLCFTLYILYTRYTTSDYTMPYYTILYHTIPCYIIMPYWARRWRNCEHRKLFFCVCHLRFSFSFHFFFLFLLPAFLLLSGNSDLSVNSRKNVLTSGCTLRMRNARESGRNRERETGRKIKRVRVCLILTICSSSNPIWRISIMFTVNRW